MRTCTIRKKGNILTQPSEAVGRHPDRRAFLKASGLAVISAVLTKESGSQALEVENGHHSSPAPAHSNPVEVVNLLQGTESTVEFSRGNTLPSLPFLLVWRIGLSNLMQILRGCFSVAPGAFRDFVVPTS